MIFLSVDTPLNTFTEVLTFASDQLVFDFFGIGRVK